MMAILRAIQAGFCYAAFSIMLLSWGLLGYGFVWQDWIAWDMGGAAAVLSMITAAVGITLGRFVDIERIRF